MQFPGLIYWSLTLLDSMNILANTHRSFEVSLQYSSANVVALMAIVHEASYVTRPPADESEPNVNKN